MRVISFNVNGIRSATNKGALAWLAKQDADVICLQEVRASEEVLASQALQLPGYHSYYCHAQKSGYSGVGILSKVEPDKIVDKLGFPLADDEGRYIQAEFGDLIVASLYMPSGTSGEERQALKYVFLDKYAKILDKVLKSKKPHIICGDWNIAHKNIDLTNWKTNQKTSGFLPEERAWMDMLFEKKGFVDAFRVVNQEPDQYTWWSSRSRTARERNIGWRIDYQVITPDLKDAVKKVAIYKEEKFSDHAPVIIDYEM